MVQLIIVLNNSGIESFEPKNNTSSLDDYSCEVDSITEITNDEKKNNLIFKTLKKGYKIQAANDKIVYLKKALVKIYQYQKKRDSI